MATNPSPQPNTIQLAATAPQILPDPGVALITYDKASGKLTAVDSTGASIFPTSGAVPGGADTQIQFNDGGAFGGNAAMVFDKVAGTIFFGPVTSFEVNPSDGANECDFTLGGDGIAFLGADDGVHAAHLTLQATQIALVINNPAATLNIQSSGATQVRGATLGFQGATPVATPVVTGDGAVSMLAALVAYGLVTNSAAQFPFDVGVFNPGVGSNNQKLLILNIQRAVKFPAGAANSKFTAGTAATGSTTFTFKKNGSSFATAVFAGAGTLATWTQASDANFAAGDQLEIDGPATADATLADFTCTLSGNRT